MHCKTVTVLGASLIMLAGCPSSRNSSGTDSGTDGSLDARADAGVDGRSDGADSDAGHPDKVYVDDIDHLNCETTAGWILFDATGAPTDDSQLLVTRDQDNVQAGNAALEFSYPREAGRFPGIFSTLLLTEFQSISFWIKSERDADILLAVTDRDGARFQYRISIVAGTWQQVQIEPSDFQPAADSPVPKAELDPARLAMGLALVDLERLAQPDRNHLWIDEVEVVRKPLLLLDNLDLQNGPMLVNESALVRGDAQVSGQGTTLEIQAPRLQLRGGILATNDASVLIEGAVLDSRQQYIHQYQLDTSAGGSVLLRDTPLYTGFPQFLRSRTDCRLELDGFSVLLAPSHIETQPGCQVTVTNSLHIGELVLYPGADVQVTQTESILIWLFTVAGTTGTFSLPDGTDLPDFSLTDTFSLQVTNSSDVMWGLVSFPGSDATFSNTSFRAVGLLFLGSTQQSLSGFRNQGPIPDMSVLADRTLVFDGGSVQTWNFYVGESAHLDLTDSLFGEMLTFTSASATVTNSDCDGSGGYIGTEGNSHIEIHGGTLTTDITTFDQSTLLLDGCTVQGTIRATGSSRVTLHNTTVDGQTLEYDQGQIVTE